MAVARHAPPPPLLIPPRQYNSSFYLGYLSNWPNYQLVAESPAGRIMAYILGKAEGKGATWHGHVSAVTVAPEYRRLGLARVLMRDLEATSEKVYGAVRTPWAWAWARGAPACRRSPLWLPSFEWMRACGGRTCASSRASPVPHTQVQRLLC